MIRLTPLVRLAAVACAASLALTACGGEKKQAGAKKPPAGVGQADGTVTLGTILPKTGSLAFLGPPQFVGVDVAVEEINAAGGVLGKPVVKIHKDSGDATTDIASQSVDSLLQQKVDAVVGASSSGVSFTVIDKITNAGVLQFSPSNTSDRFSTYNDKGLYFRSAPPDKLQGRVNADLIAGDNNERVYILNRQDDYGTGLANNIEKYLGDSGVQVVGKKAYAENAQEFSAEVADIKAKNPDAISLITFEEIKKIGPELIKQGLGPDKVKWYFVDGNLNNFSKDKEFAKGVLKGVKGTQPGAEAPQEFRKKMLKVDPTLGVFNYGAESYDAINLIALAAEAAKSDAGKAIAGKLIEVSKGGEKCTSFKQCKGLLDQGKDIDYDGVSGPIEFNDVGDPSEATIGIYQYQADNNIKNIDYRSGKLGG